MNITPQAPNIPIPTVVNPATDALRRENHQREVITQPAPTHQSAAEKGVASERERAKTPAQQNQQVNFAEIQKKIDEQNSTINDEQSSGKQEDQQGAQQQQAEQSEGATNSRADEAIDDVAIQKEIKELAARDREVRAHEQAHAATGGVATGAPSFSFEVGPDGKKYAVEGEVSVDLSPVSGDPRATITKMQKVYNAALAPANPSIQDMRVANSAARIIAQAQGKLLDEVNANNTTDNEQERRTNFEPSTNTPNRDSFSGNNTDNAVENDFDQLVNSTLESQEAIAPSRNQAIDARAGRIENFYADINRAYERPPSHQFELTA
ncbi:putative metalloprotease CJM1_0395 family protein [Thalassotalea sp. G2M2-11]|uniref:putative metalloprotease CJM1_0395 family protein n=1 Tax=Thalassotalea sp. G2M2-11 TaxID=2787627 RepID=UPI0019D0C096|nr:putative metalloprotease CJM1_0395 family protein [Thalassotalea sp. G2M2-11]